MIVYILHLWFIYLSFILDYFTIIFTSNFLIPLWLHFILSLYQNLLVFLYFNLSLLNSVYVRYLSMLIQALPFINLFYHFLWTSAGSWRYYSLVLLVIYIELNSYLRRSYIIIYLLGASFAEDGTYSRLLFESDLLV